MRRRFLFALPVAALCAGMQGGYSSARQKIALIETNRAQPGSRIFLSSQELNSWVREGLMPAFPPGVRQPLLEPGNGTARASALVDFVKVRQAQGKPPGWLMARLLEGEHPVKVVAGIESGGGRAKVDVQSVEISGMTIDGPMLDYLIRNYLLPNYPQAKVGEYFELGHRMDRLEIKPAGVTVVMAR